MGFLCMGVWISILGMSMLGSEIFSDLTGVGFIICGIGISLGPLEWIGIKFANKVNKLSMKVLMILLVFVGIKLIIY